MVMVFLYRMMGNLSLIAVSWPTVSTPLRKRPTEPSTMFPERLRSCPGKTWFCSKPTRPSSSPTAPTLATKSPTPVKIPLRGPKLVFAPSPQYPQEIKRFYGSVRGSGNFRIVFDSQGHVTSVQTVHSTGNPLLDQAAVSALHGWRAQPGQGWSVVVPITFQP